MFIESSIRLKVAAFLSTTLVSNRFLFFSIWSFVHFFAFIISTLILLKTKLSKRMIFFSLVFLAIIYEIIEWFAYMIWIPWFFIPETGIDIFWDIIVAIVGISLVLILSKRNK